MGALPLFSSDVNALSSRETFSSRKAGAMQKSQLNLRSSLPGILPTLGLTKYQGVDLQSTNTNPFCVHNRTEKLLVLREREREFNDYNKLEKDGFHVWQKQSKSKPDRSGVIREIRSIKQNPVKINWKQNNTESRHKFKQPERINVFDLTQAEIPSLRRNQLVASMTAADET
jgi:hypothetical protein